MSAHAVRADQRRLGGPTRSLTAALPRLSTGTWLGATGAGALCAIAFGAAGGSVLGRETTVEMGITLVGAALIALAATRARGSAPTSATTAVALLFALAAVSAASIIWSESPADSWLQASQLFAYAVFFAAVVAAARLAPGRWPSLLGALLAAGGAVCLYALSTKVFPGALDANDPYARLRAPFDYWNAVGIVAVLTVIPCLWLGSRRQGNPVVSALAYPLAGVALVVLMLAYSRGPLIALAVGAALWFAAVPRRVRSAAVLLTSATAAAPAVAWAFAQPALAHDRADVGLRAQAGHELGLLILVLVIVLMVAGLAIGFLAARRPLSRTHRDQVGLALVVALALVPIGVLGGLTLSSRGLTGSISHALTTLTDPHAKTPPNTPGRLTGVASVRAQYWNEALKVFTDHPVTGVGAGAYVVARERYRYGNLTVRHAHGYVVQTLADLGLIGLAVSLVLLGAWGYAALSAVRPFGWRPRIPWRPRAPEPPDSWVGGAEQIGLMSLLCCVLAFGVHSTVDWTWAIPGDACLALLCAGWLAGRAPGRRHGAILPEGARHTVGASRSFAGFGWRERLATVDRGRWPVAAAVMVVAVVLAWSQWQPLRSAHAADRSLVALQRGDLRGATGDANHAASIDPVSVDPLFDLAAIQIRSGDIASARATLQRAARRQPANAQTWLRLADLELRQANAPAQALKYLGPALYLDPHSADVIDEFLAATRQRGTAQPSAAGSAAAPAQAPRASAGG